MKNVLVTGGAGFIGQRLALALISQGAKVRVLDMFNPQVHATDSLPRELASQVELIKADVRNRDALRAGLVDIDCVVHLAAETGTGQSMYEIERYFSVNVQGTAILLDLLQNDPAGKRVENLVVASSRAIYGEGAYRCVAHGMVYPEPRSKRNMESGRFEPTCPICGDGVALEATSEAAPFKPLSIYGLTKQVQEQAVLMHAQTRGINAFALRYQNVYGPGQSLKNPYTGILAVFSNLARQNQPIEIYEDGNESRDFIYIDDVVAASVECINYSDKFVGALNVGSGQATSVMTVAQGIRDYFNSQSPISVTGAFRIGDIRHNIADVTLARSILGFAAKVSFSQGLANFLEWAQCQPIEDKAAYLRSVGELSAKGLMGNLTATK
jgi:dTDP-L-rhamnose 4-epimerase